jgi:pimeloyl-ACP methyl ester carboxylesterase
MLLATMDSSFRIDGGRFLPTLSAPTLVIHAREDVVPVQCGRYLGDYIPGARYLEVDGADEPFHRR